MRHEPYETEEFGPYRIEIYPDDDHGLSVEEEPQYDWCFLHCFHKKYDFPHNPDLPNYKDFESWEEMQNRLEKDYHTFRVSMYEHGGTTVKIGSFSDPWDSGQIGFCLVPRKRGMNHKRAERIARSHVQYWDELMTGNVWGYVIKKGQEIGDGDDEIDSCWGFVGDSDLCIAEARSALKNIITADMKLLQEALDKISALKK